MKKIGTSSPNIYFMSRIGTAGPTRFAEENKVSWPLYHMRIIRTAGPSFTEEQRDSMRKTGTAGPFRYTIRD